MPTYLQGFSATIYVSDLDKSIDFYTNVLRLPLLGRWGNHYAGIDFGQGVVIGLHPSATGQPTPGTPGSIQVGFAVNAPLEEVVKDLASRGVIFRQSIVNDNKVRLAFFGDPDGNELYLVETQKW